MASDRLLRGIFAPVTTPFRGGEIDPDAFAGNLRHYASTRLAGIVVLGSNGEAPLLDDQVTVMAPVEPDAVPDKLTLAAVVVEVGAFTVRASGPDAGVGPVVAEVCAA